MTENAKEKFWDIQYILSLQFSVFSWKFNSPQVNAYVIASTVNELPHKLPMDLQLRILENHKTKIKSNFEGGTG